MRMQFDVNLGLAVRGGWGGVRSGEGGGGGGANRRGRYGGPHARVALTHQAKNAK